MQHIRTFICAGPSGLPVDIECRITRGLPAIVIVGVAGKTVHEAGERLRGAFAASDLQLPRKRVSINLAPADVPKDSTGLDLALAVAILAASRQLKIDPTDQSAYIGELGLDGSLHPVRGLIGQLLAGRQAGTTHYYLPAASLEQARIVPGITVTPLRTLSDLVRLSSGIMTNTTVSTGMGLRAATLSAKQQDDTFAQVAGQYQAKRAALIAAAGGHSLLLYGTPGAGKTMLARSIAGLLPPLTRDEMLEITHLHSLAGATDTELVTRRPFRAPHHSGSLRSLLGGGPKGVPGELSLAHRGVLLFDELPEFPRASLESLRQPLEDRRIRLHLKTGVADYPAESLFVATANPCPCGFFGSTGPRHCACSPGAMQRYRNKLSGPLLDRIDLCTVTEPPDTGAMLSDINGIKEMSQARKLVRAARRAQRRRFGGSLRLNRDMTNHEIRTSGLLNVKARTALVSAADRLGLSGRACLRAAKVARTIADLDGSTEVDITHIAEALQYRHEQLLS